ncbi:MAG: hypothetical protein V4683_06025 [Bacteroidota bacterium]
MKNFTKRIVTIFLASLVLFTSSGFGLVEHSCSMRGKKTYSFVNKDACNSCPNHKAKNGQTTVSKDKCCDSKQVEKTENLSESIVNLAGKFVKTTTEYIVKSIAIVFTKAIGIVFNIDTTNEGEKTLLFGKSLLHFISLLRL